jgi:hypothetical protein
VQVVTLAVTTGIELERGFRPLELELLVTLLGQLTANAINTVSADWGRPVQCNKDQSSDCKACFHKCHERRPQKPTYNNYTSPSSEKDIFDERGNDEDEDKKSNPAA